MPAARLDGVLSRIKDYLTDWCAFYIYIYIRRFKISGKAKMKTIQQKKRLQPTLATSCVSYSSDKEQCQI
jgi:uncharacterized protein YutD